MDWMKFKANKLKGILVKGREKRLADSIKKIDCMIESQRLILSQTEQRRKSSAYRVKDELKGGNIAPKEKNDIFQDGETKLAEQIKGLFKQRRLLESGLTTIQTHKIIKVTTKELEGCTKGLKMEKVKALTDRANEQKEIIDSVNEVIGGASDNLDDQELEKELEEELEKLEALDLEAGLKEPDALELEENEAFAEEEDVKDTAGGAHDQDYVKQTAGGAHEDDVKVMDRIKSRAKKLKKLVTRDRKKRLDDSIEKINCTIKSHELILSQMKQRRESAAQRLKDESKAGNKTSAELALIEQKITEEGEADLAEQIDKLGEQRLLLVSGSTAIESHKRLKVTTKELEGSTKGLKMEKVKALTDRANEQKEIIDTVNEVIGGASDNLDDLELKELEELEALDLEVKTQEEELNPLAKHLYSSRTEI